MVVTLLVDVNLEGHARLIDARLQKPPWNEFSKDLAIRFLFFEDVGLHRRTPDNLVWKLCQEQGYFLLTANRNEDSDTSLGATIRRDGDPTSLPVLTLADSERILKSSANMEEVVERLLEYLLDRDDFIGTGRLFLP
jgi:hypothetical protein